MEINGAFKVEFFDGKYLLRCPPGYVGPWGTDYLGVYKADYPVEDAIEFYKNGRIRKDAKK